MVERFNGRIGDVLQSQRFNCALDLTGGLPRHCLAACSSLSSSYLSLPCTARLQFRLYNNGTNPIQNY
jgi:hypothetical protein